jgi:hypothetical protein
MYKQHIGIRLFSVIVLSLLVFGTTLATSDARRLSDLVKQPIRLFLPSQVIPGKSASFTLQAKAGQKYLLIISSRSEGAELPNGLAIGVGKPNVETTGTIPESGVVEIIVDVPEQLSTVSDVQFVSAVVWSAEDLSDAQEAQVIDHSGTVASKNAVMIGTEPVRGATMIVPGDPNMSNVLRSLNIMNEVSGDPRKKQLIDDGSINRERLIDKNLQVAPSPLMRP